jgi:hypothetical protein
MREGKKTNNLFTKKKNDQMRNTNPIFTKKKETQNRGISFSDTVTATSGAVVTGKSSPI